MTYTIYHSDTTNTKVPAISLIPGQIDTLSTSLSLYGYGAKNYGEGLMSNTVKLLENFSSPTAPNNPIEGQLWFNSSIKSLQVCYRAVTGSLDWKAVSPVSGWDSNGGSTTSTGTGTDSTAQLQAMLSAYVPTSGKIAGTGGLTGDLKLYNNPNWYTTNSQNIEVINESIATVDISSYAATRKYVDTKFNSVVIKQNTSTDWSITTAQLRTKLEDGGNPYLKRTLVNAGDNQMVSPLLLRDQSNALGVSVNEAVSKQYVTAATNAILTNMSNGGTVPQYIKDLLDTYVPVAGISNPKFTGITSHLPIFSDPNWYNSDKTLNTSVKIPEDYAATVKYVNTKVSDAIKNVSGAVVWPVSSETVIKKIDEDKGGPYVHKTHKEPSYRTMTDPLFLRKDLVTNPNGADDNEAVSAGYVRSQISTNQSTAIDSGKLLTALNELVSSGATLPWPKVDKAQASVSDQAALDIKAATDAANAAADKAQTELDKLLLMDTTISGDQLTLTGLINTAKQAVIDANISAGKIIDAAKLAAGTMTVTIPGGSVNDTVTGTTAADTITAGLGNDVVNKSDWPDAITQPTNGKFPIKNFPEYTTDRERISYSKLPDGTLIIYGYYRKFGICHSGDSIDWVTTIDRIKFDPAYQFINKFYSVTVTEVTHDVVINGILLASSDARHRGGHWDKGVYNGWVGWMGAALLNCGIGSNYEFKPATSGITGYQDWPWAEQKNVCYPVGKPHHAFAADQPADYIDTPADIMNNGKTYNSEYAKYNAAYDEIAIPPCTWQVYDQRVDGFKISGYLNKSITWLYSRNNLSCNFTAIGRWK